jgi:hypothetical protein
MVATTASSTEANETVKVLRELLAFSVLFVQLLVWLVRFVGQILLVEFDRVYQQLSTPCESLAFD